MSKKDFSMWIDNIDIRDFGLELKSYKTSSYVARKTYGVDNPGAHGTNLVPSALSSNKFEAAVICTGNSVEEVKSNIRKFFAFMFSTAAPHEIRFTDDPEVVRYAVLNSPETFSTTDGVDLCMTELSLSFLMPNPFTYNKNSSKSVLSLPHAGQMQVFNEAFECPAVFTLTNISRRPVTDLSLLVNNELTVFSCRLNPGDVIVLDTGEYEVLYNGAPRLDYWDGEMPKLHNGINTISQQNTQHDPILLSVEFYKQWV